MGFDRLKDPEPIEQKRKTSLFAPVFQLVPFNRIARVTKQKNFNKAMIDSSTEIILLDEAFSGLLEVDDWKI